MSVQSQSRPHTQHSTPLSSTSTATTISYLDTLGSCTPSTSLLPSSRARSKLRSDVSWAKELDVVQVLGGEGEEGYGDGLGTYGHTGCINALNWSSDGTLLASGSDDTRICLWKLGQEPDSVHPDNPSVVQQYAPLGLGLATTIHTGHRANIFSVKFAPHSTTKLFSCAGDHEVRVFDLGQESLTAQGGGQSFSSPVPSSWSRTSTPYTREWTEYSKTSGVCTRVLKCHRGRVKRISLEGNSDSLFLTCSEDGTVRQHDLRIGHTCKAQCPPPLCSYREHGIGLYSLTTSVMRPELFVVAGTSPYAFLHDRRMIPRLIKQEWGVSISPADSALTKCVRRFGPAQPPLIGGPGDDDDEESEDEEEGREREMIGPRLSRGSARRLRKTRRQRLLEQNEKHVTAAKLSNVNGRELLLTYSGGPVCKYDIFDDPEQPSTSSKASSILKPNSKRTRINDNSIEPRPSEGQSHIEPKTTFKKEPLNLPPPKHSGVGSDAADLPQTRSDFTTTSLEDDPDLEREASNEGEQSAVNGSEEPVYMHASDASSRGPSASRQAEERTQGTSYESEESSQADSRQQFEIRVNDDGELEMAYGSESSNSNDEEDSSPVNTDAYARLLARVRGEEEGSEEEAEQGERGESEEMETSDEDEDDGDDEDPISSSEEELPPSQQSRAGDSVLLVRPTRVYTGHRNVDTVKDVNFGGLLDNLVISGSDDGNAFVWDKDTSELLGIWKGDDSVVNVLTYHPTLPVMAVSGIDNSVKILAPTTDLTLEEDEAESVEGTGRRRGTKKFSRTHEKDQIAAKNRDASWTSERLIMPPSRLLMSLFARGGLSDLADAGEEGETGNGEGGDGSGGGRRGTRRIPLQALLQLASEEQGEDGNCVVS